MSQTARACPNCRTPLPTYAAFCYACGTATPAGIDRHTGEFVVPETTGVTMNEILPRLRALLGPSYELGERIGSGGFAEVFLARDLRLKRDVAVKVTRPEFAVNAQMMLRFRREAETIAALRHPHIMPIYDLGEAEGIAYLVMPYIRGESLKARLDRVGRLPVARARAVLLQAADALASAHEAGVVHRDVKPDNIMLDRREDQVLLMDFGIAKAIESGTEVSALTSTGLVMGTPHYMSPEQAAGERTVDARADQYALAVIGYRMLAGSLPFDGPTVRAVLAKQLVGEAAPLRKAAPDAPVALVAAIERAMAKEPDDRFAAMREFVDAVRADPSYAAEVLNRTATEPAFTPTAGTAAIAPTPPPRRTRRIALALVAVGVAGVVAVAIARRGTAAAPDAVPDDAPIAGATRADSAAGLTFPSLGDSVTAAVPRIGLPDSTAKRIADDSALASRARLTYGTPAADSFLVNVKRSCERAFAASDAARARAVCAAHARLNRAPAQRALGILAERAGRLDSAAAWYERAAPRDPESALLLARLLDDGRGVTADPARATTLIRGAADGGSLPAQRALAERLARGAAGTPRDERGAASIYERAGDAGDVPSMLALAEMFRTGRGVRKSDRDAATWWQRAAEKGDSAGQYRLGMAHLGGRGVTKSDSAALVWLRRAAAQGHTSADYEVRKRERPR